MFLQAEAAPQKLGFQVKTLDCDLAPNAHVHPLRPVYTCEQNEDSAHEKPKVSARLNEELALSNKELQATAVSAKPLAVSCSLLIPPAAAKHGLHGVLTFLVLVPFAKQYRGLHAGLASWSASVSSD